MNRLIDVEELNENLIKCNGLGRKSLELVIQCIKDTKTAYDKEKVIQKLNESKAFVNSLYDGEESEVVDLYRAISIVKEG